jgi:hypothetical protein
MVLKTNALDECHYTGRQDDTFAYNTTATQMWSLASL